MQRKLSYYASWLSNPYLLLLILAIGAIRPILGDRAPFADDYGYHTLRLAQLRHMVEQGVIFSRWMPDLAYGYGYPLFNYFAPLAYYITLPFVFLTGDVATGFHLALAVAIILSGCTMYLFMRDHVSKPAAITAAVAFMYAPYVSYDTLFRANIGEALGFFWMPLALWAIGRTSAGVRGSSTGSSTRYIAITAISYAAIILTHNVFALIFSPVLALYGTLTLLKNHDRRNLSPSPGLRVSQFPVFSLTISLLLGLLISAFFWLPALTEQSKAAFDRLYNDQSYLYSNNFLTLNELFSLPKIIPTDLLNSSPSPSLALIPILFAIPALLLIKRAKSENRPKIIFFTFILTAIIFLVLPQSNPLWQLLSLLQIIQFPWRLLAIGALCTSILIGFTADLLPVSLSPLLPIVLIIAAQPFLYPSYGPRPNVTLSDIVEWERATQTIGTTVAGEYLPITVEDIPPGPPDTFFQTPTGYIARRDERPLSGAITIQSDSPQTLTVNQFAFDGWVAKIDGERAPITPAESSGLITIDIPAGTHEITVAFRETPFRLTLDIISFLALLVALALLIRGRVFLPPLPVERAGVRGSEDSVGTGQQNTKRSPIPAGYTLALIGIGLAGGFLAPTLRPKSLTPTNTLKNPGNITPLSFTNNMQLLGGSMPTTAPADQPIAATINWAVNQTPSQIYQATFTLADANGVLYASKTNSTPRRFRAAWPTNAWAPGQYAQQQILIQPYPGTPPGDYQLIATLFDRDTLQPVPVPGSPQTDVPVGTITLTCCTDDPALDGIFPTSLELNETLSLVGYTQDRTIATSGDVMQLNLFWESQGSGDNELRPQIQLGDIALPIPDPITLPGGHRFQTRHIFRIPVDIPDGPVDWKLVTKRGSQTFGALTVDAPFRQFSPPVIANSADFPHAFTTLTGYEVNSTDDQQTIRLLWRADQQVETSYRVFVHLFDENGTLIAQADREPAAWSRPTTGWLPGEYIIDEHVIPVTADVSSIQTGFYDPTTGVRPSEPITLP